MGTGSEDSDGDESNLNDRHGTGHERDRLDLSRRPQTDVVVNTTQSLDGLSNAMAVQLLALEEIRRCLPLTNLD